MGTVAHLMSLQIRCRDQFPWQNLSSQYFRRQSGPGRIGRAFADPNPGPDPHPDPQPGPDPHPDPGPIVPTPITRPYDPNDLIGPAGFGDQNFVSVNQSLPYTINFENEPTAGPAQQVSIPQQLDANLNWQSFRLGSFGFGGQIMRSPPTAPVPGADRPHADPGYYVNVTATINQRTGIATWIFTTIEPGHRPGADRCGHRLPSARQQQRGR